MTYSPASGLSAAESGDWCNAPGLQAGFPLEPGPDLIYPNIDSGHPGSFWKPVTFSFSPPSDFGGADYCWSSLKVSKTGLFSIYLGGWPIGDKDSGFVSAITKNFRANGFVYLKLLTVSHFPFESVRVDWGPTVYFELGAGPTPPGGGGSGPSIVSVTPRG